MSLSERTKILLVDDRAENLLAYQSILDGLDLDLVVANSGAEALKQVLQFDFAVVLLDVNMPGIDGFETAALIRKRKRSAHTPIIFVTAFADEFRAAEGYASGAVDFLLSPIIPGVLQAKVKVFVELFRMTEQVRHQAEERVVLAKERMRRLSAEETNRQLQFLAEVTAVIGRSLDYDTTTCDVARLTVPTLGDRAIVARQEPGGGRWAIVQAASTEGPVEIERLSSLDPFPAHLAEAVSRTFTTGTTTFFPSEPHDRPGEEPRVVVFPLRGQKSTLAALAISRSRPSASSPRPT